MDYLLENFGSRLKTERTKASMTQAELAKNLSISQMAVSLYETNKSTPTLKFIYGLHKFGFNIEYLVFGDNISGLGGNLNLQSSYKKLATALDFLEQKMDRTISTEIKIELIDFLLN